MRFRSLMASSAKEEAIRDNRMFAECVFYCTTNATGELYPPCCIAPNFSTLREQFDQFLHFQQILHTVIINLTNLLVRLYHIRHHNRRHSRSRNRTDSVKRILDSHRIFRQNADYLTGF